MHACICNYSLRHVLIDWVDVVDIRQTFDWVDVVDIRQTFDWVDVVDIRQTFDWVDVVDIRQTFYNVNALSDLYTYVARDNILKFLNQPNICT